MAYSAPNSVGCSSFKLRPLGLDFDWVDSTSVLRLLQVVSPRKRLSLTKTRPRRTRVGGGENMKTPSRHDGEKFTLSFIIDNKSLAARSVLSS